MYVFSSLYDTVSEAGDLASRKAVRSTDMQICFRHRNKSLSVPKPRLSSSVRIIVIVVTMIVQILTGRKCCGAVHLLQFVSCRAVIDHQTTIGYLAISLVLFWECVLVCRKISNIR